jgi:hypothetical protein
MSVVVNRGHGRERLRNFTADPKVVAAVEAFAAMQAAGGVEVGASIMADGKSGYSKWFPLS